MHKVCTRKNKNRFLLYSLALILLAIIIIIIPRSLNSTPSDSIEDPDEVIVDEDPPMGTPITPSSFVTASPSPAPKKNTIVLDTVAALKQTNLHTGDIVRTKGYYTSSDQGGATYVISDQMDLKDNGGSVIALDNNLFAKMVITDDTACLSQFGAYGDGKHDDSDAIYQAINSGIHTIKFDKKTYKCNTYIELTTNNISIDGNKATLFTDNDYLSTEQYHEWFFTIKADNVQISDLNLLANETIPVGYKTQFCIFEASNITIQRCTFTVPDTAPSCTVTGGMLEYTNMDLYTGWHNITIDQCSLYQYHDGEAGGCIWIRDLYKEGCSNLTFTNNICEKMSHDEILSISLGSIENVEIRDNSFTMLEGDASPSAMCFSIGYAESAKTDRITFKHNTIKCSSSNGLIWFGNCSNVVIEDNKIDYTKSDIKNKNCMVFYKFDRSLPDTIHFLNNDIAIYDNSDSGIVSIFSSIPAKIANNTITCFSRITMAAFYSDTSSLENNQIALKDDVLQVCSSIPVFTNNTLYLTGKVNNIFEYYHNDLESKITLKENIITYDNTEYPDDLCSLLLVNNIKMNNNKIELSNNTISALTTGQNLRLYTLIVKDITKQKIQMINNTISNFNKYYISNSNVQVNTK